MHLDTTTVFAVASFVLMVLGGAHVLFYFVDRSEPWLLKFGSGNMFIGLAALLFAFETLRINLFVSELAFVFATLGNGLKLISLHTINRTRAPVFRYLLQISLAMALAIFFPSDTYEGRKLLFLVILVHACIEYASYQQVGKIARLKALNSASVLRVLFGIGTAIGIGQCVCFYVGAYPESRDVAPATHIYLVFASLLIFIVRSIAVTFMCTEERHLALMRLALSDPLTSALNRAGLQIAFERISRGAMVTAVAIDMDHFKSVNDTFGHTVGDQLLVKLVTVLRQCVRKEDLIARLGGDEFAVVMQNVSLGEAVNIADEIRQAFIGATRS